MLKCENLTEQDLRRIGSQVAEAFPVENMEGFCVYWAKAQRPNF